MKKQQIVVLRGGAGIEREVSIKSAKQVASAAEQAGFEVVQLDPKDGLQALDQLGKDSIVLPILHGIGGEDGTLQLEIEKRGLAFLGSKSEVSKVCFNKWSAREAMKRNSLPVAEGELVDKATYSKSLLRSKPHVLKSVRCGSSIGVYVVKDPAKVDQVQVDKVFEIDQYAVIEELVVGTEITVSILGSDALPVIEIQPPNGEEYDFHNKYVGPTKLICPPESISSNLQVKAQDIAKAAHTKLGCRHLSRVDMIVRHDGTMVILEINTIPGMTDHSLYPRSARVAGYTMPELVKEFARMVKEG